MRNKHYPSSHPPQPKRPLQLRVSGEIYDRIVHLADGPVGSVPVARVADRALELGVAQLEAQASQRPAPVTPLTTRGTDDAA